jgi:hypothetical protein
VRLLRVSILGCALLGIASTGCGGVWYSARANTVAGKVEQAKEVGAETSSPYEYYSAKERMTKAMEEASKADYSDAIDLLDEAEEYADKAIQQATAVRKGAGR